MTFRYSKEHLKFIRRTYKKHSLLITVELFEAKFKLGKEYKQLRALINNHKMLSGRSRGVRRGKYKLFNEEQVAFIKKQYQLHVAAKVAELLNEKYGTNFNGGQIKSFVKNHGINCPRSGHFVKGIVPWNTGTKGIMKPNSGTFRVGQDSINIKPLGSTRTDKDGYIWVKSEEPSTWMLLSRFNWEKAHGKENRPDILRLKDGNKSNCEIDNLEPLSFAEHGKLTGLKYSSMPQELRPTLVNIARLDARINTLNKEK